MFCVPGTRRVFCYERTREKILVIYWSSVDQIDSLIPGDELTDLKRNVTWERFVEKSMWFSSRIYSMHSSCWKKSFRNISDRAFWKIVIKVKSICWNYKEAFLMRWGDVLKLIQVSNQVLLYLNRKSTKTPFIISGVCANLRGIEMISVLNYLVHLLLRDNSMFSSVINILESVETKLEFVHRLDDLQSILCC